MTQHKSGPSDPSGVFELPAGLSRGDRLPALRLSRADATPFRADALAGRWLVIGPTGAIDRPCTQARLARLVEAAEFFDNRFCSLIAVSSTPTLTLPAVEMAGLHRLAAEPDTLLRMLRLDAPAWVVVDPALYVRAIVPQTTDGSDAQHLLDILTALPAPQAAFTPALPAPILILPDVFEAEFCDHLIALYETHGGESSGFMRDLGGKTVAVHDPGFKVRRDHLITDKALMEAVKARMIRRVIPEIARIHHFKATRLERYLVACYDGAEGGHFRPHRDNTTIGTAHRRFAVSINLNEGFEGGEVSFPEYGPTGYKAPKGGAVIFSCALLHAVSRVTRGRRYAFLPFLYDEEAARIRQANASQIESSQASRVAQR